MKRVPGCPWVSYNSEREMGESDLALTAEYQLGRNTLRGEMVHRPNRSTLLYGTFNFSDERMDIFGIERGRRLCVDRSAVEAVFDLAYQPVRREVRASLTLSRRDLRLFGSFSFFRIRSPHHRRDALLKAERELSDGSVLTVAHEVNAGDSRVQLTRNLDPFNTLKLQCTNRAGSTKVLCCCMVELHRRINTSSTVICGANWSTKYYNVGWTRQLFDGLLRVELRLPFKGNPSTSDFVLSRRFDL